MPSPPVTQKDALYIILVRKQICPLPRGRHDLIFKAVCGINILGNIVQNKAVQALLQKCAPTEDT
jgi:hypothetical protein